MAKKALFLTLFLLPNLLWSALGDLPVTYDYEKGQQVMEVYQKPAILTFVASGDCPWSECLLDEVFQEDQFVSAIGNEFLFIAIDFPLINRQSRAQIELNHSLKNNYEIDTFPTMVMIAPSGEEITRLSFPAEGGKAFAKALRGFYGEYLDLVAQADILEGNPKGKAIEKAYERALSLQTPSLIDRFMNLGLEQRQKGYFLVEQYIGMVNCGKRESKEARLLRRKIMRLKGDEMSEARLRIGVCDYAALHERKPNIAIGLVHRLISSGKINRDGVEKLSHLMAHHFIEEQDYLTALRFAKELVLSDSVDVKESGQALVSHIELAKLR